MDKDVAGDLRLGRETGGDDEADVALAQYVANLVGLPRLGPAVRQYLKAEATAQPRGYGARIANPPFQVVPAEDLV